MSKPKYPPHRRSRWHPCRTTIIIPLLLVLTILLAGLLMMGETATPALPLPDGEQHSSYLEYSVVGGFFRQDEPDTDPASFDFMKHNFGLIDRDYDSDAALADGGASLSGWQRFEHKLSRMNHDASSAVTYRLLFLGRHGQGYHNVAESFYGTAAWDCYYSTLEGSPNGSMIWVDAHLTKMGIKQAEEVDVFWKKQINDQQMPTPQSYYVSPLDRALHTADLTFQTLNLSADRPYKPIVKELLREGIGIHTCDRRSSKTDIRTHWPDYAIEDGFSEKDELWVSDLRESTSAHTVRLQTLLDDIFVQDQNTWISLTSHGGTIGAILRVVGHQAFSLPTGGVIPVLVKVERVQGKRPTVKVEPWQPKPDCKDDPSKAGMNGIRSLEAYLDSLDKMSD